MAKEAALENNILERLRAYLNSDNGVLSEADQKILERLDFAYDNLKLETPANVAKRLVKKYGIHINTARTDVRNCMLLFSPVHRHEVEWIENYIINDCKLQIESARAKLDMKAWATARGHLIKMFEILTSKQLEIDPALLGHNKYFIAINFGDKVQNLDFDYLQSLPPYQRQSINDFLFRDIADSEAIEILNDKLPVKDEPVP